MTNHRNRNLTAVLVHAAWADASSWNKVVTPLSKLGLRARGAQIPLTSLADDVAALKRLLRQVEGPVLLAGHSYAGAVITAAATGDPRVQALVYIAAIAPDLGETVGELFRSSDPGPGVRPQIVPDADGFLWLPPGAFATAVAPDASPDETALMDAAQHPISLQCLGEPMTAPAWRTKPSWYLVAEKDRMIAPAAQRSMAARMGARVHALDVDHTPLTSAPEGVARVIAEAAGE
jgi:pimeloyl-ACP methyl ester carboxylesterase